MTPGPIDTPILGKVFADKNAVAQVKEKMAWYYSDETLRDVGGNREGGPLPRVRCDLHDRRRDSGRWRLVATVKAMWWTAELGAGEVGSSGTAVR